MTSLTDVYDGGPGRTSSRRRVYAGTALLGVGAALALVALLVATTDLFAGWVSGQYGARKIAGIVGGLAVPAALVGVFVGLPAGRRVQAAAAVSASLCLLGVALFWHAYPTHWAGHGDDLTLLVSVVYALGLFSAVWALFTAVVTFKTRNDPGGMLEMNVTRLGRTKVVEAEPDRGGSGSVGFLGSTPDGDVETQTNRGSGADSSGSPNRGPSGSGGRSGSRATASTSRAAPGTTASSAAPASDGGAATDDISSPMDGQDAEIMDSSDDVAPTDRYCGNCRHFEYVRSSEGMVPYCGDADEAMDDMDACEEWVPNRN